LIQCLLPSGHGINWSEGGKTVSMSWRRWGLNDNPYQLNSLEEDNLHLFVGRGDDVRIVQDYCKKSESVISVEGESGIGLTAFGEFIRHDFVRKRLFFTPHGEISPGKSLCCHCLILNLLVALDATLQQKHPYLSRDPDFIRYEAGVRKLLTGFEGKSIFQDSCPLHPIEMTDKYASLLDDASQLISKLGYDRGTLVQIRTPNLRPSDMQAKEQAFLMNLCSFFKVRHFQWLLTGGRDFGQVLCEYGDLHRRDVVFRLNLNALSLNEVDEILDRRKELFSVQKDPQLPLAREVIHYLYSVSSGRIRNILQLSSELVSFFDGDHTISEINLNIARPILQRISQKNLYQMNLTNLPLSVLGVVAQKGPVASGDIAKHMHRSHSSISKALLQLNKRGLVQKNGQGRRRIYSASMEVKLIWA